MDWYLRIIIFGVFFEWETSRLTVGGGAACSLLSVLHPPLSADLSTGLFPLTMRGDSEQWNSSVWITHSHAWWDPLVERDTHTLAHTTAHTPRLKGPAVGTLSTSVHCLPLQLNWGQIEQSDGLNLTSLPFWPVFVVQYRFPHLSGVETASYRT